MMEVPIQSGLVHLEDTFRAAGGLIIDNSTQITSLPTYPPYFTPGL